MTCLNMMYDVHRQWCTPMPVFVTILPSWAGEHCVHTTLCCLHYDLRCACMTIELCDDLNASDRPSDLHCVAAAPTLWKLN